MERKEKIRYDVHFSTTFSTLRVIADRQDFMWMVGIVLHADIDVEHKRLARCLGNTLCNIKQATDICSVRDDMVLIDASNFNQLAHDGVLALSHRTDKDGVYNREMLEDTFADIFQEAL